MAGAWCVVYFNRAQSEVLRSRPRVQLHPKYNNWELEGEGGDRVEMAPVPEIARGEGMGAFLWAHIPCVWDTVFKDVLPLHHMLPAAQQRTQQDVAHSARCQPLPWPISRH